METKNDIKEISKTQPTTGITEMAQKPRTQLTTQELFLSLLNKILCPCHLFLIQSSYGT